MKFITRSVDPFCRLTTASDPTSQRDTLQLLICHANSVVTTTPGLAGLWWPLKGRAFAVSSETQLPFNTRTILASDSYRSQEIVTAPDSLVVAVLGTQHAWAALQTLPGSTNFKTEPALFPAVHAIDNAVRRQLLLLMRGVAATTSRDVTATEMTILGLLVERLQRKFEKLIQRSPGQNASRKKAAFMRVQRTRNLISFGVGSRFDVRSLAHMANYSVWHFIHVYNCVFGETPYVHISRLRMDQAKNLIRMNERCMSEIAQSVGFDSRTTLTRAIKKRYGVCASQLRHATDL